MSAGDISEVEVATHKAHSSILDALESEFHRSLSSCSLRSSWSLPVPRHMLFSYARPAVSAAMMYDGTT